MPSITIVTCRTRQRIPRIQDDDEHVFDLSVSGMEPFFGLGMAMESRMRLDFA
ncbi:hypothetical protein M422DRAFT_33084, partial [Sphaerobolus stellatus SS14]